MEHHLETKHKGVSQSVYECNYCTFKCHINANIRLHYDRNHEDKYSKKFHYDLCSYESIRKDDLENTAGHSREKSRTNATVASRRRD